MRRWARAWLAGIALACAPPGGAQPSVDANTATRVELDAITGIGPSLADRIVEERGKGPFRNLEDLQSRVRGVGEANLRKMRDSGLVVGRSQHGGPAIFAGYPPEDASATAPARKSRDNGRGAARKGTTEK
jgi:competence protein ComEA